MFGGVPSQGVGKPLTLRATTCSTSFSPRSFSLEHRPFIQGCMTPKAFHYFILLGLSWNS